MKVNVGGVPEHFNLAWHLAIEQNRFADKGIVINWHDVPGGTGAMCKSLRNGELDLAIALTEGIVNDIINGSPSKIIQFYVNSPLHWGIYAAADSPIHSISGMQGGKYAISRQGSGSHLMAYVNAYDHQLVIDESDFVIVGNIEGAREALKNDTAQLFMWEKYMTKPLVDSGEFKMIGECRTPWPCFVIAARNEFIEQYPDLLTAILNVINLSCLLLKNNSAAPQMIARRYGIKEEDAMLWFKELEYSCQPDMDESQMYTILNKLLTLNIINKVPSLTDICYERNIVLA